jgi:hypothetical protein
MIRRHSRVLKKTSSRWRSRRSSASHTTRVYYTFREIDLGEYTGDSMDMQEVATIAEAVSYMLD